jgi:hypothetical protein
MGTDLNPKGRVIDNLCVKSGLNITIEVDTLSSCPRKVGHIKYAAFACCNRLGKKWRHVGHVWLVKVYGTRKCLVFSQNWFHLRRIKSIWVIERYGIYISGFQQLCQLLNLCLRPADDSACGGVDADNSASSFSQTSGDCDDGSFDREHRVRPFGTVLFK